MESVTPFQQVGTGTMEYLRPEVIRSSGEISTVKVRLMC